MKWFDLRWFKRYDRIPLERTQQIWLDGMWAFSVCSSWSQPRPSEPEFSGIAAHIKQLHHSAAVQMRSSILSFHQVLSHLYLPLIFLNRHRYELYRVVPHTLPFNKLHRRPREDPSPAWSQWENAAGAPLPGSGGSGGFTGEQPCSITINIDKWWFTAVTKSMDIYEYLWYLILIYLRDEL